MIVVPTVLGTNASGKRAASRCIAFQPVQCAGMGMRAAIRRGPANPHGWGDL